MTDRKKPGAAFWMTAALAVVILILSAGVLPYPIWVIGMQVYILLKYRPEEFALLVAIFWAVVFAVRWAIKLAKRS